MAVSLSRAQFKIRHMWPSEDPSVVVSVVDLGCIECAAQLVRSLDAYPGVKRAELDYPSGRLYVWGPLSRREITRYVQEMGYEVYVDHATDAASKRRSFWTPKTRAWLAVVSLLLLLGGVAARFYSLTWPDVLNDLVPIDLMSPERLCFLLSIVTGMLFPLRTALYSVFRGVLETNFIVCIAVAGAMIVGAWFDASLLAAAFSVFGLIEARRLKAARVLGLTSDTFDRAGVPGRESWQAMLTRSAESTAVAGHPLVKFYTTTLVALAVLVIGIPPLVFGTALDPWLYLGLKLLVVSRPGALVAAVPSAITAALNHARKMGIALKDSMTLMRIAKVNAVAFDQIGTLTQGKMLLSDIVSIGDVTQEQVLQLAASVEWGTDHPLGPAIAEAAASLEVEPKAARSVNITSGLGAEATIDGRWVLVGNSSFMRLHGVDVTILTELIEQYEAAAKSCLIVAEENEPIGMIALTDTVREGSQRAIRRLYRIGGIKRVALLSEESERRAIDMAKSLDIKEVIAGLSPAAKVGTVEQWKQAGEKVAVIGDGSNPSVIVAADVGIIMTDDQERGTEDDREDSADVVIMPGEPSNVPFLLALGRRTSRVIKRNIVLAILLKLAVVYLIFAGKLTLGLVGVMEMGSSLLITWSGTRLLRKLRIKSR